MSVTVQLLGPMRKPQGKSVHQLEHRAQMKVQEVLQELGYADNEMKFFALQLNGAATKLEHAVPAGAELTVFLPVGGG